MHVLRTGGYIAALGAAAILISGSARARELKTMDEVGAALYACWTPPANIRNASVTLSFGFRSDGNLMGPPRATAVDVQGDDKTKKAFADAARQAVEKCTPLELAPALARGIGGGVYTMRFTSSDL